MSSHLNFYGVLKEKPSNGESSEKKIIRLFSFSRNDDVYRYFDENVKIAFCYEKETYTDIDENIVHIVISDIKSDIETSEKRLNEYEKHVSANPEFINDIISLKEYIEDLRETLHYVSFIEIIVGQLSFSNDFEKIVANIM